MKKHNLYLWIIALVGLMTSCSQDETDALQTTDESNRVTLTASLPEDFAQIGTRALPTAPADHQLRCILEVWTQDQTSPALKYREEKVGLTGDNVVFDFKIEEGTYDCLFWADFIETGANSGPASIGGLSSTHYDDKFYVTNNTTNGLKAISIRVHDFNTDARDAFFGHYVLEKQAVAMENPPIPALTRPFAKLTIKERDATNYSYCAGLTATYNKPSTFNVLDGTGSSYIKITCRSKSTESQTLFSDYIFTDASSTLGSILLTFTGTEGKNLLSPVTIPAGIPLKRNYKTNATGRLISEEAAPTNDVKLTVDINSVWNTEEYYIAAKVGDFYYDDETYSTTLDESKTCIGIVYEVNADGEGGKIVGLKAETNYWSTENAVTGATNTTDGRVNMKTIADLIANSGGDKTWDTYPVFKWVTEQNNNTGNWNAVNDKWYLPAIDELDALYTAYKTYGKKSFDDKLKAASGDVFGIPFYWSSTEDSNTHSCYKDFANEDKSTTPKTTTNGRLRCIRVF